MRYDARERYILKLAAGLVPWENATPREQSEAIAVQVEHDRETEAMKALNTPAETTLKTKQAAA